MLKQLTAIILTYNEADHITDCIASVKFADAVIVFDSGSSDDTVALARAAGAAVMQRPFDNYASQRNAALQAVQDSSEWVLFVDADERVTPELAVELRAVIADGSCAGYRIPRHNYIFGRLTRGAGWYPDYQTRLLRLGAADYDPERQVHEVVRLQGDEGTLTQPFIHYNYRDLAHFLGKQRRYAAYDAHILYENNFRPRPHHYITQPLRHFKWRFVDLRGYRDGWHGLKLCLLMAWYEWRKHRLLGQLWRDPKP